MACRSAVGGESRAASNGQWRPAIQGRSGFFCRQGQGSPHPGAPQCARQVVSDLGGRADDGRRRPGRVHDALSVIGMTLSSPRSDSSIRLERRPPQEGQPATPRGSSSLLSRLILLAMREVAPSPPDQGASPLASRESRCRTRSRQNCDSRQRSYLRRRNCCAPW
jgi:hypothetical protein